MNEKKKVVVGMSGGVDSSVAAMLLKEQGYDVIGVTMQIWEDEDALKRETEGGCCGLSAVEDARRVASQLEIPHYVMNFRKEFREKVMDYFVAEYLNGRTPNPCIACNRYVKWESLLYRSMEIGADYIATGHYACIKKLPNNRFAIANSVTAQKDQTYALYNLTQEQLAHTLMPVGGYTKPQIREMAENAGLMVAHKPDSQEICFIPDHDYAAFIEKEKNGDVPQEGNFVSVAGEVLGRHKGITHYTIGQRKGLGIALGKPMFVKEIRTRSGEYRVVASAEQYPIKLAYATTYHKAQGLTLDKVHMILDGENSRWQEAGLGYLGLSRCKTLEGLTIDGLARCEFVEDKESKNFMSYSESRSFC